MELIGAAFCGDHHLAAAGHGEVGRLVVCIYAEFLDAFRRRGQHARAVMIDVGRIVAVQIAGVVAAVQHERVLVGETSGNVAAGRVTFRAVERGRSGRL